MLKGRYPLDHALEKSMSLPELAFSIFMIEPMVPRKVRLYMQFCVFNGALHFHQVFQPCHRHSCMKGH